MCVSVAWNGPFIRVTFEFNWRKMLNSRLLNPSPDQNCLWHSRKRTASLSFYACANSRAHLNMQCGLSLPVPLCARIRLSSAVIPVSDGTQWQWVSNPSGGLRPNTKIPTSSTPIMVHLIPLCDTVTCRNNCLSIYSQLCVVHYGRWFLVGVKFYNIQFSQHCSYRFCSGQVGRI